MKRIKYFYNSSNNVPLVGIEEIATIRESVTKVTDTIFKEENSNLTYEVGTINKVTSLVRNNATQYECEECDIDQLD